MSRLAKLLLPDAGRVAVVLKLAAPVIAANLTQTFINILDTVFVGFLPPEYSIAGQAGLGYSVPMHWMIGGFVGAVSVGTQAMTARRFGEGNRMGAGKVLFNSAIVALVAGTLASLLAMYFTPELFRLFTDKQDVLDVGIPYARARFSAILAMVMTLSFKAFFDGLGKTHYHLVTAVLMNVLNAGLNYVLVFGKLGFPKLYVLGAGLGSSIASYLGLGIMVTWALWRKYRVDYAIFRPSNLDPRVMGRIVRLSLPSGVATVIVMSGFLMFFKWVGMLHEPGEGNLEPVLEAATKVIVDILSVAFMSTMGLGVATATLVSQNLGRGEPGEAERYAWVAVEVGVVLTGSLGLVSIFAPDAVMGIFTNQPGVLEAGRPVLRMLGAVEFSLGIGMVLAQALFGAGNTRFVMYVELFLHVFCLVPLSYLFGIVLGLGLVGVWSGAVVYMVLLAAIMTWKFSTGDWKHIRI